MIALSYPNYCVRILLVYYSFISNKTEDSDLVNKKQLFFAHLCISICTTGSNSQTVPIKCDNETNPTELLVYVYIQGVTGGRDQTSGGCSLCETIPKKPKTPISKVERFGR